MTYLHEDIDTNLKYYSDLLEKQNLIWAPMGYYASISLYLGGDVNKYYGQLVDQLIEVKDFLNEIYLPLRNTQTKQQVDFTVARNKHYPILIFPKLLKAPDHIRDQPPVLNNK